MQEVAPNEKNWCSFVKFVHNTTAATSVAMQLHQTKPSTETLPTTPTTAITPHATTQHLH